ncbi:carbohydrate-binding protein [Rhodoferax sp.]|uniref:carbohydrate-binding protein n=1 Tax=Rhodoferax sp. TaxID=50421 RepID=UPI00374CEAB6
MTDGVLIVKSTLVTPAMMLATNVPETDYSEWAIGTTYAKDARVILAAEHKIYQSMQAGNVGKQPLTEALWWIEVGPTNRWKPYDLSNSTQMVSSGDIFYEIATGIASNAVALLNMSGALGVRVRVIDPTFGTLYDKSTSLVTIPTESSWYAWFFGERVQQTQFIALDLPSYPNAKIRIDVTGAPVIGVILVGQLKTVGYGVKYGVRVGIKDFSQKKRNTWGDTILVEGPYAKRASFPIVVKNTELDNTYAVLASVRATPCLFIGYKPYACTIIFGFPSEFEIAIPYANESDCTLDIEGLT